MQRSDRASSSKSASPVFFRFHCALLPASLPSSLRLSATFLHGCATSDSALVCRLSSVLDWLYGIAIVLGLALILTVALAFRAYSRNRENRGDRR